MQYIADIKRKEGMEMAEAPETRVDLFISSSYEHEERLNKEIDDMHQFRHEIMQLKADSDTLSQINEIVIDHEKHRQSEAETLEYIKRILKNKGDI